MSDITLDQIEQLIQASERRINTHTDKRIDELEKTMLKNFRFVGETISEIHDAIDVKFRLKMVWKRFWGRLL